MKKPPTATREVPAGVLLGPEHKPYEVAKNYLQRHVADSTFYATNDVNHGLTDTEIADRLNWADGVLARMEDGDDTLTARIAEASEAEVANYKIGDTFCVTGMAHSISQTRLSVPTHYYSTYISTL